DRRGAPGARAAAVPHARHRKAATPAIARARPGRARDRRGAGAGDDPSAAARADADVVLGGVAGPARLPLADARRRAAPRHAPFRSRRSPSMRAALTACFPFAALVARAEPPRPPRPADDPVGARLFPPDLIMSH